MRPLIPCLLASCLVLLVGCAGKRTNEEIKKSWWLYGSGYHIGDALRFDNDNLKGDTIYFDNEPIAVISFCGTSMFRTSAILVIESIDSGESGTYHDKGPR